MGFSCCFHEQPLHLCEVGGKNRHYFYNPSTMVRTWIYLLDNFWFTRYIQCIKLRALSLIWQSNNPSPQRGWHSFILHSIPPFHRTAEKFWEGGEQGGKGAPTKTQTQSFKDSSPTIFSAMGMHGTTKILFTKIKLTSIARLIVFYLRSCVFDDSLSSFLSPLNSTGIIGFTKEFLSKMFPICKIVLVFVLFF